MYNNNCQTKLNSVKCEVHSILIFYLQNEFYKNVNSVSVGIRVFLLRRLVWRLIGVCVFCAAASVVALFILEVFYDKYM